MGIYWCDCIAVAEYAEPYRAAVFASGGKELECFFAGSCPAADRQLINGPMLRGFTKSHTVAKTIPLRQPIAKRACYNGGTD